MDLKNNMAQCDWIDLAQDRKWRVLVNLVINLCFMKGTEYIDEISDHQLHKNKSSPWNLCHKMESA
jgi:hypothetical protein